MKAPRTRVRTIVENWDKIPRALAMLNSAETVKVTGGAVEIGGVRIEPCNKRGGTVTTAHRDQLAMALQRIQRIAGEEQELYFACTCPEPPHPHATHLEVG